MIVRKPTNGIYVGTVKIGDYAQLSIGVRKSVYGKELAVVLDKVVPAEEIESNWK